MQIEQDILIAIIGSLGGAVTALAGAYVVLRRLGIDLRKGRAEAVKIEIENQALVQKLENERDELVNRTIEQIVKQASESMTLSEKSCKDRIDELEQRYGELEQRYRELEGKYNQLVAENAELKKTYQTREDDFMRRIGLLMIDKEALEKRIAALARDVQSITDKGLKAQGAA